ncbi:MAG: DUF4129 domain-containing protein [Acidobacteria bacterium]|nr:DUF4129 domain-containing protein [Acidobacteriota bacterium]MCA1642445.1 DUF4129 domain-containing protein [Acidobacteriota bacterium]
MTRSRATLVVLFVALCGATSTARAASLDGYRSRVSVALSHSAELLDALKETGSVDGRREAQALAGVRDALPPRERVEWAGGVTDVDNSWLRKELEAYAALPAGDAGEKRKIAARVNARLAALSSRLDETAGASSQAARDREAEKGRLQSILRRPEYNEQASHETALGRLWKQFKGLLSRLLAARAPMAPGAAGFFSVVARVFVYALAVAVIVFVVWRFGPRLVNQLSTRRRKGRGREARVVLGERLAPDESAADLLAEAERLARAGELRGAIRKAYIAVLCELGDRKLIRLAQHKTNRDYLNSVRDRDDLFGTLRPLTQDYERHWYGFAPATPADWDEYRALCNRAIQ